MGTKKEKVTDDNFEDLLIKSVSEASEYIKEEKELTVRLATLIEEPPVYSKAKIKINNYLVISILTNKKIEKRKKDNDKM